uniref:Ribosomal protein S9 n=1 Tax=Climaconeis sp. TaxID=2846830 RepID=A0A8F8X7E4_9STRA|nr:ribosomal protein S9 [Climaconeis sp.]
MDDKSKLIFQKNNMGIGKHKQAIARVFITSGNGNLTINKISGIKYLQYNSNYLNKVWKPLEKLNLKKKFNIIAIVNGGGLTGQAQAIQLGLAKLLSKMNNQNIPILKSFGLLTRDARIKERKKYGLKKARKAPQYSKR